MVARPELRPLALIAAAAVALAACTPGPGWHRVTLPEPDVEIVGVSTTDDGRLLVAGYGTGEIAGRVYVLDCPPGDVATVPLSTGPGYGPLARWLTVTEHDGELFAVGGAAGGAHFNTRWTVWSGTTAGLVERPQTFETFGGWGAGTLTGAAFAGSEVLVVGSWQSEGAGLDIVGWGRHDQRFERMSSTATALASTRAQLVQVSGVAATADEFVLAGSVTALDGSSRVSPAVWTGAGTPQSFTRIDLPVDGSPPNADAQRVTCDETGCLVLGRAGDRLLVWWLDDTGVSAWPAPPVPPGSAGSDLPIVTLEQGRAWLVTDSGLFVGDGGDWRREDLAEVEAAAIARCQGHTVIGGAGDTGTLWWR